MRILGNAVQSGHLESTSCEQQGRHHGDGLTDRLARLSGRVQLADELVAQGSMLSSPSSPA
jgi:hypothetical protein